MSANPRAHRSAGMRGSAPAAARRLDLIHTNNSPKPVLARVSGRSRLKKKPLFFFGALNEEDFDLVETLPEAMAIRDRLLSAGRGPVVLARLLPREGADGAT